MIISQNCQISQEPSLCLTDNKVIMIGFVIILLCKLEDAPLASRSSIFLKIEKTNNSIKTIQRLKTKKIKKHKTILRPQKS